MMLAGQPDVRITLSPAGVNVLFSTLSAARTPKTLLAAEEGNDPSSALSQSEECSYLEGFGRVAEPGPLRVIGHIANCEIAHFLV